MFPLPEKPAEPQYKDPKRAVVLNLTHCSKEYIFKLVEEFFGRYWIEKTNGFLMFYVQDASYEEFTKLVAGYSYWLEWGKFHMIFDPPIPRCSILLTAREK